MAIIKVPKPPASAFNPERRVSALLKNQLIHLQEAEFRLPANLQTNVYINAIKTEREAADYIAQVTAALHQAHANAAAAKRAPKARVKSKGKRVIEIAAVAEDRPARKAKSMRKSKKKTRTSKRKK